MTMPAARNRDQLFALASACYTQNLHPDKGFLAFPAFENGNAFDHTQYAKYCPTIAAVVAKLEQRQLAESNERSLMYAEVAEELHITTSAIVSEINALDSDCVPLALKGAILRDCTFLVSLFVFGGEPRNTVLPPWLGQGYVRIAKIMGCAPTLSHTAVTILNWKCDGDVFAFDDLSTISGFFPMGTDERSCEDGFYKGTVLTELPLGRLPGLALGYYDPRLTKLDRESVLMKLLVAIRAALNDSARSMKFLIDNTDPATFYHCLRPLFDGGSDLPDGIDYGKAADNAEFSKLQGGSSIQSPSYILIYVVLGFSGLLVDAMPENWRNYYLTHLLGVHRDFLGYMLELDQGDSLRLHVAASNQVHMIDAYNKAVDALANWIDAHFAKFIKPYIIAPKLQSLPQFTDSSQKTVRGSGGTTNLTDRPKKWRDILDGQKLRVTCLH